MLWLVFRLEHDFLFKSDSTYCDSSKMTMEYWSGQFHAFKTWNLPDEYSMAILKLYIFFRYISVKIRMAKNEGNIGLM